MGLVYHLADCYMAELLEVRESPGKSKSMLHTGHSYIRNLGTSMEGDRTVRDLAHAMWRGAVCGAHLARCPSVGLVDLSVLRWTARRHRQQEPAQRCWRPLCSCWATSSPPPASRACCEYPRTALLCDTLPDLKQYARGDLVQQIEHEQDGSAGLHSVAAAHVTGRDLGPGHARCADAAGCRHARVPGALLN